MWKEILTCFVSILVFREDREIQRNDPSHTGCPLVALNCWILSEMVWLFPGIIHSCDAAKLRETLKAAESFKNVLFRGKWENGCTWNVHLHSADDPSYYVGHIFAEYPPLNKARPAIRKFFTKMYSFHSHFSSAPFSTFMWEQAQDQFFATSISRLLPHTLWNWCSGRFECVCLSECVSCGNKALGTHYWIKFTMKSREGATKGFCPN